MSTQHETFPFLPSDVASFVRVNLNDLDGPALDWAVAQAADITVQIEPPRYQNVAKPYRLNPHGLSPFRPSMDWAHAGLLIRKFQVALTPESHFGAEGTEMSERWVANIYYAGGEQFTTDPARNELVAACRAIVATKFGDVVSIPSELGLTYTPLYPGHVV